MADAPPSFDTHTLRDQRHVVVRRVLAAADLDTLRTVLANRSSGAGKGGRRHVEREAAGIEAPARTGTGMALAREALGPQAHFVRGIYFDKSPQTNGYVTWHQDRKIAVEKRVSIPGWGPWSRKDGRWHVQPPIDWLERMIAVRLHRDDADERSGGLRLIAGSHRNGLLAPGASPTWCMSYRRGAQACVPETPC